MMARRGETCKNTSEKEISGKSLDLDTASVTGWESQILWVQSVGWGPQLTFHT